jgi:hypothetical protein
MRKPATPCEWTGDGHAALIDDIKRAEDISIRHGDALAYGAVRRDARQRCEARLFAAIADARGIGIDAVIQARQQLDHRGFDWMVNVPMAGFTLAVAIVMRRKVRARFPDDRRALVVATALLSAGLGISVIGIGQVWAFAVEGIRIGNDHLSYRGLRIPWGDHRLATFALTVLTTGIVAAIPARRNPHRTHL